VSDPRKNWRVDTAAFMRAVSHNQTMRALIDRILEKQNELYINLYQNVLEMTLDQIERVSILGLDKYLAEKFNSKVTQYKALEGIVPMADHRICEDGDCLIDGAGRCSFLKSMYGNISGDAIPRYITTAGGKIPMHRSNVVTREDGNYILKKPWNGQEVAYPDADPVLYGNTSFSFAQYEE